MSASLSIASPAIAGTREILIIAGEVSGDERAAALVAALREFDPGVSFYGIGGPRMRAAGVRTDVDIADMAVIGFVEVLKRYAFFRRVFHRLLHVARTRRPQAVILVDYPGFNLRFAARAHAMGLKVIYYVCPQVWAWHQSRIPKMARTIDRLITIFPFEPRYFAESGLRVDFAGHPLVDEAAQAWDAPAAELPWNGDPRVALLPGSRRQEIERHLPCMLAAAAHIARAMPETAFLIPTPDAGIRALVQARLDALGGALRCAAVSGEARQVLRQAQAAIVASGTATLEASLMLCPMVIVYRVAPLTYAIARRLIRVAHIGMVNIVAGREVCPEFVQDAFDPATVAAAVLRLLQDGAAAEQMRADLQGVNHALGSGGASARAAACVIDELQR